MSVDAKILQLIDHLITQTNQNKLKWEDTADEQAFRVVMPSGVVRIESCTVQDPDGEEYSSFLLTVLNRKGQMIEQFRPVTEPVTMECETLHAAARRSARRVDEILDALIEEAQR